MEYTLKEINTDRIDFVEELAREAELEGFRFVRRTILEWNSGENNFSKRGESFYGVFLGDKCVAIGGLNIDPYSNMSTLGRVRHLYVSKKHRRKGLAKLLLKEILKAAEGNFQQVRLYTPSKSASQLYERFGFTKSLKEHESHIIEVWYHSFLGYKNEEHSYLEKRIDEIKKKRNKKYNE